MERVRVDAFTDSAAALGLYRAAGFAIVRTYRDEQAPTADPTRAATPSHALGGGRDASAPTDAASYDLLALGVNTYWWAPDGPTWRYLARAGDLRGTLVVVLSSALGASGRAAVRAAANALSLGRAPVWLPIVAMAMRARFLGTSPWATEPVPRLRGGGEAQVVRSWASP